MSTEKQCYHIEPWYAGKGMGLRLRFNACDVRGFAQNLPDEYRIFDQRGGEESVSRFIERLTKEFYHLGHSEGYKKGVADTEEAVKTIIACIKQIDEEKREFEKQGGAE
jgi:hypothetical protein